MNEYDINFEINIKRKQLSKHKPYLQSEIDTVLNALLQTNLGVGKDEFKIIEIFEKIMSELENQRIGYFSYIQNLLSQVIFNTLRSYTSNEKSNYSIQKKILTDSRRYIIDKYFQNSDKLLTRGDIALQTGHSSQSQFNKIFKKHYNYTPYEYRNSDK